MGPIDLIDRGPSSAYRPFYLRSNRSTSFHATRSETFSGYTFFDVSFVELPQRFQEFRLAGEHDRLGVVAKRSLSLHTMNSETMCIRADDDLFHAPAWRRHPLWPHELLHGHHRCTVIGYPDVVKPGTQVPDLDERSGSRDGTGKAGSSGVVEHRERAG